MSPDTYNVKMVQLFSDFTTELDSYGVYYLLPLESELLQKSKPELSNILMDLGDLLRTTYTFS